MNPGGPLSFQLAEIEATVEAKTGNGKKGRDRTLGQVVTDEVLKLAGKVVMGFIKIGVGMEEHPQNCQQ